MSGIYVEAKVRLSDIVAVIAKHHPETVLPAGWQDDPGMVVFDCVRVRSDDALAEISQSEIDEASSYSFADDDDDEEGGGVPDQAALADFAERLLCGDVAVARVLAMRAFADGDREAVEQIFIHHGRTAAISSGASHE